MNNHKLNEICKIYKTYEEDSFVGLKIKEGKPTIYLPLGYNTEKEITGKDMDALITAIKKYAPLTNGKNIINDDFESIDYFPYFSYKWIIINYIENGYFRDTEMIETKGYLGKINWKKTIYQNKPIMTKKGPIYDTWITRKNAWNEDNIITKIHEFCVYESYQNIGWIFSNKINIQKPNLIITKENKTRYLNILKEELKKTFQDQKKELLKNMIKIITGLDSIKKHKQEIECGTKKFYVVWEKMIDIAFGNIKNKEKYYPRGIWNFAKGNIKSSALRPDTLKIIENKAYIYDAKYYSYCNDLNTDKLPKTDSIQKQITYAEYLDNNPKFNHIHTIYNAFLLPGNIENIVEYIGYASSEWKKGNKEYHNIYTFLLDTKYLINHYTTIKEDLIKHNLDNIDYITYFYK